MDEAHHAEARALLLRLLDRLEAIEAEDDWDTKRMVVETLVTTIRAQTIGAGHQKQARRRPSATPSRSGMRLTSWAWKAFALQALGQ